ncbi:MAG: hypothetical protein V7640_8 [Betaproteobacteria bacterium]
MTLSWPCRTALLGAAALIAACQTAPPAGDPTRPDTVPESWNMRLLGHEALQARSAYQPVIIEQNGRWLAYIGHHGGRRPNALTGQMENNGTSIVDVTNPRQPRYLVHIAGDIGEGESGGAQMVRICPGRMLPKGDPAKFYMLRVFGDTAQEIWDVTSPERPQLITTIVKGLRSTHKNWWECDTGIAYLVSGPKDWRVRRMTKIYDLSDPAKPLFIRDYGIDGQQPGSTGEPPFELHGPISMGPQRNRVYFGHGNNKFGILQIVDRQKLLNGPREATRENLLYPQVGRLDFPTNSGAHTVFPLLDMDIADFRNSKDSKRDFIFAVNESILDECNEARQMVWIIDVTQETKPFGVSNWTVPEASGNFCSRGARFGAHASNENMTPIYYKRLIFVSWFNAGVRTLDIRNPYSPKEVAYYIPAITANTKPDPTCVRRRGAAQCKVAIQTNNVEVDDRGYIYITDRSDTGLHILELTGAARGLAQFERTIN